MQASMLLLSYLSVGCLPLVICDWRNSIRDLRIYTLTEQSKKAIGCINSVVIALESTLLETDDAEKHIAWKSTLLAKMEKQMCAEGRNAPCVPQVSELIVPRVSCNCAQALPLSGTRENAMPLAGPDAALGSAFTTEGRFNFDTTVNPNADVDALQAEVQVLQTYARFLKDAFSQDSDIWEKVSRDEQCKGLFGLTSVMEASVKPEDVLGQLDDNEPENSSSSNETAALLKIIDQLGHDKKLLITALSHANAFTTDLLQAFTDLQTETGRLALFSNETVSKASQYSQQLQTGLQRMSAAYKVEKQATLELKHALMHVLKAQQLESSAESLQSEGSAVFASSPSWSYGANPFVALIKNLMAIPINVTGMKWPSLQVRRKFADLASAGPDEPSFVSFMQTMPPATPRESHCPLPIPGFTVLCMTDVTLEFLEALPLFKWVEFACAVDADVKQKVKRAPESPNPQKFIYLQEDIVEHVRCLCYEFRDFLNDRDAMEHGCEASQYKNKQKKVGHWPRFRRAAPRPQQ